MCFTTKTVNVWVFFCDFKKEEQQIKIQSKIKEQQQKNPVTMKTPNQPTKQKKNPNQKSSINHSILLKPPNPQHIFKVKF